jgi:hypothetical protein
MGPRRVTAFATGMSPAELIGVPPEEIPESLLTDPAWAAEYHRLAGTKPTRGLPVTRLEYPPDTEAVRNYAGVPPDTIPERLLTDPIWAAEYHQLNRTPGIRGTVEPSPLLATSQRPAEILAAGVPRGQHPGCRHCHRAAPHQLLQRGQ